MSKSKLIWNRIGIVLNYLSLFLIFFIFEWMVKFDLKEDSLLRIGLFLGVIFFFVSFYLVYWKTKWWKYMHQEFKKYDERELKYITETIRKSYSIFTVIILGVLLIFAVFGWAMDNVFVIGFLYLAHLLPASILKWQGYKI